MSKTRISWLIFIININCIFTKRFATNSNLYLHRSEKKTLLPWKELWLDLKKKHFLEKSNCSKLGLLYMLANFEHSTNPNSESLSLVFDYIRLLDKNLLAQDILIKHYFDKGDFYKVCVNPVFKSFKPESLNQDLLLIAASSFELAGNKSESARYFDYLEKHFGEDEVVVHKIVTKCLLQNQYAQALEKIDSFLQKINLRAKHGIFLSIKAAILSEVFSKHEEALKTIDQGLALCSRNSNLLEHKLALLQKLGKQKEFYSCLQEFVDLTQDDKYRKNLIGFYIKNGLEEKALEELAMLNDENNDFLLDKIILTIKLENFEKALDLINSYLSVKGNDIKINSLKKNLLVKLNRYDDLACILINELPKTSNQLNSYLELFSILEHCSNQQKIVFLLHNKLTKNNHPLCKLLFIDKCMKLGFFAFAYDMSFRIKSNKINIDKAQLLCAQAKASLEIGFEKQCFNLLKKAASLKPQKSLFLRVKADMLLKKKKMFLAFKTCKKLLKINLNKGSYFLDSLNNRHH